ncbi:MAG: hypothetical protein RIQ81_60 [Pseudomonadota bacterium]|jgi:hypothetical protein
MRILGSWQSKAAFVSFSSLASLTFAGHASARSVFLNGVDVSSSRSQELRNVQIRINEKGDIFISAPHYQVTEEDFFTPLSRVPAAGTAAVSPVAGGPSALPGAPITASAPAAVAARPQSPAAEVPAVAPPAAAAAPAAPAKGDKPDSFSNIGLQKSPPESMPPVLPATPPAK